MTLIIIGSSCELGTSTIVLLRPQIFDRIFAASFTLDLCDQTYGKTNSMRLTRYEDAFKSSGQLCSFQRTSMQLDTPNQIIHVAQYCYTWLHLGSYFIHEGSTRRQWRHGLALDGHAFHDAASWKTSLGIMVP